MATRGRPKTDNIFRFNVATDLTDNKRFIRFKRSLGADERTAYLTLVRFFNFIASNYALTGRISVNFRDDNSREEADVIADFCWWDGDPQILLVALHNSGFLENDGTVHEWFDNQPYASKKLRDREFPSISETKISGNSRLTEAKTEVQTEAKEASKASLLPPNPLQDVDKLKTPASGKRSNGSGNDGSIEPSPRGTGNSDGSKHASGNGRMFPNERSFWPKVSEFLEELQEPHVHGKLDQNDLAGLRADLKQYGLPCKAVQDWIIMRIAKDRSEKRAGENGMDSQIGWIRKQIRDPNTG